MMDPKHYQMEYLRRRIRQQLYAVQLGLLGTDDHQEKKATGTPTTPPPTPPATADRKEPRGMFAIAKPGAERDEVDKIYFRVRKLAEVVEGAGVPTEPSSLFPGFVKEMRKEMKPLEVSVGRRVPPPGAATGAGAAPADDAPAVGGAGGKATSKTGTGKGAPGAKGAPPAPNRPVVPGKTTSVPKFRPQPNVFGKPQFGR